MSPGFTLGEKRRSDQNLRAIDSAAIGQRRVVLLKVSMADLRLQGVCRGGRDQRFDEGLNLEPIN